MITVKTTLFCVGIIGLILLFSNLLFSQHQSKYPFLFRKKIRSKSGTHELKQVLYGRIYNVQYLYLPKVRQYLIYSNVEKSDLFSNSTAKKSPDYMFEYVLLNEFGNEIRRFETNHRISTRSGFFYDPSGYSDWLFTGDTSFKKYAVTLNEDLTLTENQFYELLDQKYAQADYTEFVNMRHCGGKVESAVVLRKNDKLSILLSSVRSNHLNEEHLEDEITNLNEFQYYSKRKHLASNPIIQFIRLETNNTYPYRHLRTPLTSPFRIKNYYETYNGGWSGVAKIHGIPIFVPGERAGITLIQAKLKNEKFQFKLDNVERYFTFYNLGLRTFELPTAYKTTESLVFMEHSQNCGENRIGGGSFVVKKADELSCQNDLPESITEERFQQLPLSLQEALMFPNETTNLKIDEPLNTWIPELLLLKNLVTLHVSFHTKEISSEIIKLKNLSELYLTNGNIEKLPAAISELKNLKRLDISSNKFQEFPKEIFSLTKLTNLDIGFNEQITQIPVEIRQLTSLTTLDICETSIENFPNEMATMEKLYVRICSDKTEKQLDQKFQHLLDFGKLIE